MKLYRQSKSKYWWVDHTFPDGSRIRQSTKATDKAIARIRAKEIIDFMETSAKSSVKKGSFFAEYLTYSRPRKSAKALKNEIHIWNTFTKFIGSEEPWNISVQQAEEFFTKMLNDEKKYSPATINNYNRILRIIFNRALRWKYALSNPFTDIDMIRYETKPPRFLTQEELNKFIFSTRKHYPHLLPLFIFYFLTGIRRSEAFRLEWQDIDFERKLITVKNTKAKRPRFIPLTPMAEKILKDRKDSPKPFEIELDKEIAAGFRPLNRISTFAEIDHVTLHDLRRSFATYMAAHLSEKILQQLVGHEDYSVTDVFYIGTNAGPIRDKMVVLDEMITRALNYKGMTQLKIMT
ncbi:MAG: site-specific integrase [Bacteroidetes bacterium]|nr:site-specific integrase [Bacteroidota bacterium]